MTIYAFVYNNVTDRRTDRQTDRHTDRNHINIAASYSRAIKKLMKRN